MIAYKITGTAPALYVIQTIAHGHTTHQDIKHGPYKNDESAKRRIRDLKRKDAPKADGDIGTKCITAKIASDISREAANVERDNCEAEAEINSDMIEAPAASVEVEPYDDSWVGPAYREMDARPNYPRNGDVVPNPAAKLAMSSPYGNHDFVADEMTRHGPYTFTETVTASPIARQRGVYPAIPKRAYQR